MYSASAAFNRALKHSHTSITEVGIDHGGLVTSFDVLAGANVVADYDAPIRRSFSCSIIDTEARSEDEMRSLLDPLTAVFAPYRGLRFPDGTEELVPLGRFYPQQVNRSEVDGAVVYSITAYDAALRCQGNGRTPYFIPTGTRYDAAVADLLSRKFGQLNFRLPSSPWTTAALLIDAKTDIWAEARKLAASAGFDLAVDRNGVCAADPRVLSARTEVVWSYTEGANADFAEPEQSATVDDYPNVVVVVGTNPGAVGVTGIAADDDPSSLTYRYGQYGEQVRIIEDERVTSNAQATALASVWLSRLLGPQNETTFTAVANPLLDPGDIIEVTRERMGLIGERLVVAKIDLPLDADQHMTVVARRTITSEAEQGAPIRST